MRLIYLAALLPSLAIVQDNRCVGEGAQKICACSDLTAMTRICESRDLGWINLAAPEGAVALLQGRSKGITTILAQPDSGQPLDAVKDDYLALFPESIHRADLPLQDIEGHTSLSFSLTPNIGRQQNTPRTVTLLSDGSDSLLIVETLFLNPFELPDLAMLTEEMATAHFDLLTLIETRPQ